MRSALAAGLCAALLLLWAPVPAAAHDSTIAFTVVGNGAGGVRAAGVWTEDGHPVDVPVIVLLTAVRAADGPTPDSLRQVGPVRMTAIPGRTDIYEVPGALPPGQWQATAESAVPALGRGQAVLDVGAVATGYPADFPPRPSGEESSWERVSGWLGSVAVCAVIAGTALAFFLYFRRHPAEGGAKGRAPRRR